MQLCVVYHVSGALVDTVLAGVLLRRVTAAGRVRGDDIRVWIVVIRAGRVRLRMLMVCRVYRRSACPRRLTLLITTRQRVNKLI